MGQHPKTMYHQYILNDGILKVGAPNWRIIMLRETIVQKAFGDIMDERIHKVASNKAETDEFYNKANEERNVAFDFLNESLTTERQRNLLNDLESAWNFVEGLMQEFAYRQGLQDSQMIHKELSELGISVTKESIGLAVRN